MREITVSVNETIDLMIASKRKNALTFLFALAYLTFWLEILDLLLLHSHPTREQATIMFTFQETTTNL